ncbi:hypothetical protein BJ742DRAFT_823037 [Cladochytrium replicatum]|nr:hypothetical protein BJ742DRAFT_823037 [Cladochytrium replicatum]
MIISIDPYQDRLAAPEVARSETSSDPPSSTASTAVNTGENGSEQVFCFQNLQDTPLQHRRSEFVARLVYIIATVIMSIWPNTHSSHPDNCPELLPLQPFIETILRRSKTSFSTLQLALFYLLRLSTSNPPSLPACGRRAFIAALMIASKYHQDAKASNRAWAQICSLDVQDINAAEWEFLEAVGYRVHVTHDTFTAWGAMLLQRCGRGVSMPKTTEVGVSDEV